MAEWEDALKTFEEIVPHGDESFMVLKAHLLAEHSLAQFVLARAPAFERELEDRNCPVRSGLALILLAQALSMLDEVPSANNDMMWPALKALNSLRNDLAHNLYPNKEKLTARMQQFISLVIGGPVDSKRNLNQDFRVCAQTLVACLAIDRAPLTIDDTR